MSFWELFHKTWLRSLITLLLTRLPDTSKTLKKYWNYVSKRIAREQNVFYLWASWNWFKNPNISTVCVIICFLAFGKPRLVDSCSGVKDKGLICPFSFMISKVLIKLCAHRFMRHNWLLVEVFLCIKRNTRPDEIHLYNALNRFIS